MLQFCFYLDFAMMDSSSAAAAAAAAAAVPAEFPAAPAAHQAMAAPAPPAAHQAVAAPAPAAANPVVIDLTGSATRAGFTAGARFENFESFKNIFNSWAEENHCSYAFAKQLKKYIRGKCSLGTFVFL
jgi:hypothetical protein